ncbi:MULTISPECIES: DUF3107 domain-containing protein [Sciscionella]|uniref:DUF3107 domain-containing protein n=1 Tax=Sciscionella TaxID=596495 RepID=UPI00036671D7|nr:MULTISPECIES: DUF3107 domain-containing protein [Sciscionella]
MEVKIGVAETPREIVLTSNESPDEVEALVSGALAGKSETLTLTDDKGRKVIVPTARLAYVEVGPADQRRVGFDVS